MFKKHGLRKTMSMDPSEQIDLEIFDNLKNYLESQVEVIYAWADIRDPNFYESKVFEKVAA